MFTSSLTIFLCMCVTILIHMPFGGSTIAGIFLSFAYINV